MFLVPICCIKHTVSTLFLPCLFHKTPISLINGFYCAPWTVHCAVTCSHFLHLLRIIKAILTPLAISSQYLTNIWPLLLCPTRRKLPLFSTNVHLHPLSLQTFRLSSVPHKNPLRHDNWGGRFWSIRELRQYWYTLFIKAAAPVRGGTYIMWSRLCHLGHKMDA